MLLNEKIPIDRSEKYFAPNIGNFPFQIYYFIQPKTTGMTIINDTLEQIRNFQRDKLNTTRAERESKLTQTLDGESETPRDIPEDEMKSEDYDVKVIPLYVPDDALVKVFIIHSSHKSALANAPFAAGFKHQVHSQKL